MSLWEPVDINRDGTEEEYDKWDSDVMNDLEIRLNQLRQYNKTLNESHDEDTREEASIYVDMTRNDIEELVANEICDKLTILLNNTGKRLGIQNVKPIDFIRRYNSFKLADNGELTYV